MSLADEYARQRAWRDWETALAALPLSPGQTVLDLGCGIGDVAAEIAARGPQVLGYDTNEELLHVARARAIPGASFACRDLRDLPDQVRADGIWCSFAAAYVPDLAPVLSAWLRHLRPGGFVALTEIDDLFGHEPLGASTSTTLERYVTEALAAGRYDFRMGRKLRANLERCGVRVVAEVELRDREFAASGPLPGDVVAAWQARFERMQLLRLAAGAEFAALRDEFLGCLQRSDHRSRSRVVCCIGVR